eukprot:gene54064-72255_t
MRKITLRSRARASSDADRSRRKSSALMAFSTFSAVSGRTPGRAFSTRSTVASDTPAVRATSCTVARLPSNSSSTRQPLAPLPPNLPPPPLGRQQFSAWESEVVKIKNFGTFKGKSVDQYTLTSSTGVEVDIINWGGVVRDWRVPTKSGLRSVVLGFDTFDDYPKHSPHLGALAGRVANRIAGARLTLDGTTHAPPAHEAGSPPPGRPA